MSGYPGMNPRYWTREEEVILLAEYPTGGFRAVQEKLPYRSRESIAGKADRMGISMGRAYRRQPTSEWIDAAIRRAYETGGVKLKPLAKALDRNAGWIKWRALELGVSKPAPGTWRHWEPDEDALLEKCLERGLSVTVIGRHFRKAGYARTAMAIRCRMETKGLGWNRDFWSASDVGRALGVDIKRVTQWIERKQLKATRGRGPSVDDLPIVGRMLYQVRPIDVRKFMLNHPLEWDHRRVKKEILLDLLCGNESGLNTGGLGVQDARELAG